MDFYRAFDGGHVDLFVLHHLTYVLVVVKNGVSDTQTALSPMKPL